MDLGKEWSCTLVTLTCFACTAFLILRTLLKREGLTWLPMPHNASVLWGHEKTVFSMSAGMAYAQWLKDLNTNVLKIRGALGNRDLLVLADPFAVTHIMQRRIYDYPHSNVVRPRIARLLGKSLAWVEGEQEHKRMRQLVATSLAPEAIRRGAYNVHAAADTLQERLQSHLANKSGSMTINVIDWTNQATLDVIGRFAFAHDFGGGIDQDARKILSVWRNMAKAAISRKGLFVLMILRRFPFLNHLPLEALLAQGNVRHTIREGIAKELIRRSQNLAVDDTDSNNLLSRLASAHEARLITMDELMDHITTYIFAGSETSSQTLGYALWELAKDPERQFRLRDECLSYAEPHISYDDSQTKLPYLDAVVREILRLHPALAYMERVSVKEDILPLRHPLVTPDGKQLRSIKISAGQIVVIPIHTINRMDSVWGDGSAFRPERWLEEMPPRDILSSGWSNVMSFGDGPRNCVGFRLALFQIKVLLMTLVRHFEFQDSGAIIVDKIASSMQPTVQGQEELGPYLPITVTAL
ncbi:cytochrome P450 [Suillus subalutaceus]|uniref:cytochrome P450 n=1 Tax=Suillus subalutaceus TaxID=48586 RepID=UPI001B864B63|nr:cytochrome P450 [Suillus subalutaceus]KAG1842159.1 cytochrome P450 [Suillus subalutaceus]